MCIKKVNKINFNFMLTTSYGIRVAVFFLSSLGDGYTFPTRLVSVDSEQGNVEHQAIKW